MGGSRNGALIRLTIPREEIRKVMGAGIRELMAAWAEFDGWIAAEGHTPGARFWECHVAGPESGPDPTTWRTELDRPPMR